MDYVCYNCEYRIKCEDYRIQLCLLDDNETVVDGYIVRDWVNLFES